MFRIQVALIVVALAGFSCTSIVSSWENIEAIDTAAQSDGGDWIDTGRGAANARADRTRVSRQALICLSAAVVSGQDLTYLSAISPGPVPSGRR